MHTLNTRVKRQPTEWEKLLANHLSDKRHIKNIWRILLGVPGWRSWLSIWLLISAQVVISRLTRSSSALGSVLTAQNLLGIISLSLPLYPHPLKIKKQTLKKNSFKLNSMQIAWIHISLRYTNGEYAHEKTLNIIHHQGNASQNPTSCLLVSASMYVRNKYTNYSINTERTEQWRNVAWQSFSLQANPR